MKNTQHKNYCLLASVQNHSATSAHKVTVQILDRKQMRCRRPVLLSVLVSLKKSLNGLSSLQTWLADSCYAVQTSTARQRVTALTNSSGAAHGEAFHELQTLQF